MHQFGKFIYEFEGNLMLFALRRRIISRKRLRNNNKKKRYKKIVISCQYIIQESLYHFTVHIFLSKKSLGFKCI